MNKKHLAAAGGSKPGAMVPTMCGSKVALRLATILVADVTCQYCAERGAQR